MRVNAVYSIFYGCITSIDSQGRDIVVLDAHRDGKRYIVRADEKADGYGTWKRRFALAAHGQLDWLGAVRVRHSKIIPYRWPAK